MEPKIKNSLVNMTAKYASYRARSALGLLYKPEYEFEET